MSRYNEDHLNCLQVTLSNHRAALAQAKSAFEQQLRCVWISQTEQEIAHEIAFLAKHGVTVSLPYKEMTDDQLFAALGL